MLTSLAYWFHTNHYTTEHESAKAFSVKGICINLSEMSCIWIFENIKAQLNTSPGFVWKKLSYISLKQTNQYFVEILFCKPLIFASQCRTGKVSTFLCLRRTYPQSFYSVTNWNKVRNIWLHGGLLRLSICSNDEYRVICVCSKMWGSGWVLNQAVVHWDCGSIGPHSSVRKFKKQF